MTDKAHAAGLAPAPGEVTGLLLAWQQGDRSALDRLIPLVYVQLRRIAEQRFRNERAGHTLQPSAIVHETYLKLIQNPPGNWRGRAHFFAVASHAMREILVDHARRRDAQKRGGGQPPPRLNTGVLMPRDVDVIDLDDALETLARLDSEQARIVELRFFGGLTVDEVCEALGISAATVHRKWTSARAWLHRELRGPDRDA